MKKLKLFLSLWFTMFSIVLFGQAEFEKIKLTENVQDSTALKVAVQSASNEINWQYLSKFQEGKGILSTGLLRNGLLGANADPTKYNITAGIGIISNFDNPDAPTYNIVHFPAITGKTPTYLATSNVTYMAINGSGAVVESASPFTAVQRRELILIGAVVHSNHTTINAFNNISAPSNAVGNQLYDFMQAIGAMNVDGNKFSANGANLQLNKSAGNIFKAGSNFANDWKNPHQLAISSATALTLRYRTQNGTEGADVTSVNPNVYDLNNVLTAVPSNNYTIQTIAMFQTGLVRVQYGQETYSTLSEAEAAIATRNFVTESNIAQNGIIRAYLVVKEGTTSLLSATAKIIDAGKFGATSSSGGAVTSSAILAALGYTPENAANKQNSLTVDGSGVKFPTVDAVNTKVSNIDNTSDANKPISTATQTALNLKAPLASPTLTGTPAAPTATAGTNTTQIATTAFVTGAVTTATTPDATTLIKGKIQLAGDLAGTAAAPTVPALATKEPTIAAGTTAQYYRGDKTFQTLDKTAVGLSNVDNTSDANKPISTATQTALNLKENVANKNIANGYAGLGSDGKLLSTQLPAITITDTFVVGSQVAMLALTAETGDVAVRTDLNKSFILKGTDPTILANWQELLTPTSAVTTVFGRNGAVTAQSGDYTADQITETATRVFQTPTQRTNNDATSSIQTQLNGKQATLSGTGFVKSTAGTISYDTSTYLTSSGAVTSFNAGTTGLTPSTATTGAITLSGTLGLANGGTGATSAAAARTTLGATTVGGAFFTLTDPSAVTFPRINLNNTVSTLDAATFRTAIGAGTSSTNGTVTSVAALTLGTTGTDLSSTVANGTTTPVITLNVPSASASNRGALTAADWSLFNGKQNALTNPVTGTGTTGTVPVFTGTSTLGNSLMTSTAANMLITSTTDAVPLTVKSTLGVISTIGFQGTTSTNGYNTRLGADGNEMIFYTTNAEKMRIASGGNVGIGTNSPTNLVQLSKTISSTIDDSSMYLGVGGTENLVNSYKLIGFGYKNSSIYPSYIGYQETNNGSNTTGDLIFGTRTGVTNVAPSERMRITSGGNVGIGTTSPAAKLTTTSINDVLSPTLGTFSGGFGVMNTAGNYGLNIGVSQTAGSSWLQGHRNDGVTTAYDILLQPAGGKVGIGVTSPNEKLTVAGKGYFTPYLPAVISGAGAPYYGTNITLAADRGTDQGAARIWARNVTGAAPPDITFETSTSSQAYNSDPQSLSYLERMCIKGAGNVGIGTSAPTGKLTIKEVDTSLEFNTDASSSSMLSFDRTAGTYEQLNFRGLDFRWQPSDVTRMTFTNAGVLNIAGLAGTGTAPIAADASGNLVRNGVGYKVYTCIMSQSGTTAPTVTVLDNTLGGTVVWTRTGVGFYVGTLTSAFTSGKTTGFVAGGSSSLRSFSSPSTSTIQVVTANTSGSATDGLLSNVMVEARVYN